MREMFFFGYAGLFSEKAGLYAQVMNFAAKMDLRVIAQKGMACYD
jgi:hypothetical protein